MNHNEYLSQLDDCQREVVQARNGYHLVLAPPGCGKTHTLAERICYAHDHGVPYDDMLCLTFTNRASREMLNRISKRINDDSVADLQVGNVHRYCSRFLFDGGVVNADSSIIDDEESVSIIADYMHEDDETVMGDYHRYKVYQEIIFFQHLMYQIEHEHPMQVYLHPESFTEENRLALKKICQLQKFDFNTQSMIDIYHNAGSYIDDANAPLVGQDIAKNIRNLTLKMYYASMFEQYKRENDMLDFEDLLLYTYDAYREDKAKPTEQRAYDYYHWIQVDEVQDLNEMQLAIIDLLTAEKDYTVMYLGDEQQAI
ncbi:MAG: UvrD-helicase domain-containing protein, partial [Prevotella sp.]|nr:UvrD-helicase domain-containing protein [Prevotella sp.]